MMLRTLFWLIALLCSPLSFPIVYVFLTAGSDLLYYVFELYGLINSNIDFVFMSIVPLIVMLASGVATCFAVIFCLTKLDL